MIVYLAGPTKILKEKCERYICSILSYLYDELGWTSVEENLKLEKAVTFLGPGLLLSRMLGVKLWRLDKGNRREERRRATISILTTCGFEAALQYPWQVAAGCWQRCWQIAGTAGIECKRHGCKAGSEAPCLAVWLSWSTHYFVIGLAISLNFLKRKKIEINFWRKAKTRSTGCTCR